MEYIDSHCHINDKQFNEDLEDVVKNAIDLGVTQLICVGTDIKTSEKAIEISEKFPQVFATCGVHPHDSEKAEKRYVNILEELSSHPKVVAIGEMGLDYFYDFSDRKIQKKIFRDQIELAMDKNLPVVIHNRDSDEDLFNVISDSGLNNGVIHCFASDYQLAEKLINLGLNISFTGMVTFVKSVQEVVKKIDIEKIMIETDSPYLSPKPFRGKRNEPKNVIKVAEFIAELKQIDIDEFCMKMIHNTRKFFNLPNA